MEIVSRDVLLEPEIPDIRVDTLRCTLDAEVWASAFMQVMRAHSPLMDKGFMIGWFANAIMTGYDCAKREDPSHPIS